MIPAIPRLNILPVDALVLHEDHDNQRTEPLVQRLREVGQLRNPPIVSPLEDGTDRYMVLDGANRVTALGAMEIPHILAQVVEPTDPHLHLMTWNHVVWGMKVDAFIATLRAVPDLGLLKTSLGEDLSDRLACAPIQIQLANGSVLAACTTTDIDKQTRILHDVVDVYKTAALLDRTNQMHIETFYRIHDDLTALVIFPSLDIKTVMLIAGRGHVLPTGITRFTVSPRALHLNYPLHELSCNKTLAQKQEVLEGWVADRIKRKRVRYYAETTFLFDE
jgi:hypothetical protein